MGLMDFGAFDSGGGDPTDSTWNPRKLALSMGLFDNDTDSNDPVRFASALGLTDSEKQDQGLNSSGQGSNYLDDNLGAITRSLPIDQPSGSIVSGGREDLYHKYSQMLDQQPESENLLSGYLGRMPTHAGFRPSGIDAFNAAVIGGGVGLQHGGLAGMKAGEAQADKPFNEARQDWQAQGPLVEQQAKMADSARNRQAAGILGEIRQREIERKDRQTADLLGTLRQTQQQNANTNAAKQKSTEDYYGKRIETERRGQDLRAASQKATNDRLLESLGLRGPKLGKGIGPFDDVSGGASSSTGITTVPNSSHKILSPEQQMAQRRLNQARLTNSNPAFESAITQEKAHPAEFMTDQIDPSDPESEGRRDELRKQYALYQTIMQMMDQGNQ